MGKMILVLDESGAKGYAKTREQTEGEIGVMAGFVNLESNIRSFQSDLDDIVARYKTDSEKKFHIADLDKAQQAALRDDVFEFIRQRKIRWFYQAIYAEGFHQAEFSEGRGGEEDGNASLHVTLFENMFLMGLVIARESCHELTLEVKTDHVDASIVKKFKKAAERKLDVFLARPRTGFDRVMVEGSQRPQQYYFKSVMTSPDIKLFSKIEYEVVCEYSSLTVMADILANSVYYFLNQALLEEPGISLNYKETLKSHPLVDLAYLAENEKHVPSLTDIVYRRTK